VVPIADAHEAILQPRAQGALHLAAALLAPELQGFFVGLWHDRSLIRLICRASADSIIFVTFRLADSAPRELLDDYLRSSSSLKLRRTSRNAFRAANPPPWDDLTEACYHGPFPDKLDEPLEAAHGSCALREPRLAQIVADRLSITSTASATTSGATSSCPITSTCASVTPAMANHCLTQTGIVVNDMPLRQKMPNGSRMRLGSSTISAVTRMLKRCRGGWTGALKWCQ
jgi:hypothetical protein